ncbi:MAG TPA: PVC-type heme-binding CxxCH protein [Roseimicrobium sp.]|nr:PVC-type heme-binding CxxCH protein [Roseimicrobium sp.]
MNQRAVSAFRHFGFPVALTFAAASLFAADAPVAKPAAAAAAPTEVPLDYFAVPEGMEIKLVAKSPLLSNPTNFDIDKDGRMWIAEGVNYRRSWNPASGGDRIIVLQDSDGDGVMDKSHTFVQEAGFVAPLGVAVIDNKVIVSQPPDLIVYTDVDRNLRFDPAIDKREVILTGFNGKNHDHSLHSVTAGPDGQWYFNSGNTGALFTDKSGKTFRIGSPYFPSPVLKEMPTLFNPQEIAGQKSDDGSVWVGGFTARMNPDGSNVHIIGHNYRNSYEQSVTSFGDIFQNDNDDPPACRVSFVLEYGNAGFASADGKRSWQADKRGSQSTPVAEWRQEDPGTMPSGDVYGGGSPTGNVYYEGGALGEKYRGMFLSCEAGRNVVFGYLPKLDGAGWKLERFDFLTSNKEKQFAGSDFLGGANSVNNETKTLFRPSDVAVGPDGAIYVTDWFDARVGGHQTLDKTASGAIYRIAPKGFKGKAPSIDLETVAGQIAALKSPAVNVRNAGFQRLKAGGEASVAAVSKLLGDSNPYVAARAVWLLSQLGDSGVAKVTPLLKSGTEQTRVVAYRALRRQNVDLLGMAERMAKDPSAAVRRDVALSLRGLPFEKTKEIIVELAKRFDGKDRTYLEALGTGCFGNEAQAYAAIAPVLGGAPDKWSDAFARIAWRLHAPMAVADHKARALSPAVAKAQRKLAMDAIAFTQDAAAPAAMMELAGKKDFPYQGDAIWWLFNRKDNDWKEFNLLEQMVKRGLYNPDAIEITAMPVPDPKDTPNTLPTADKIAALKGNATRGALISTACQTCHQIGSQGAEYGPALTVFGQTQTREVIINAILDPSADIAHGYEGTEIVAKDGSVIHGLLLAPGDPVIIKSMGGLTQTIPAKMIKSRRKLERSLMLSAAQQGLSAQDVADVVAYLKSGDIK